jgi:hypothetical protein
MDPRAKLYLLLLANLMLFFHVGTGAEAVATGLFLLLFFLSGHTRTGIRLSVVYFGLLANLMLMKHVCSLFIGRYIHFYFSPVLHIRQRNLQSF